jgi:hypothetical protein
MDSNSSVTLSSLRDAHVAIIEYLGRASNTATRRTISKLESASLELTEEDPEAGKQLRMMTAAYAFDVMHDPALAMPVVERLAAEFPGDPQVLGNKAELALALWPDSDRTRSAIDHFLAQASTPALQVGGYAFAVASGVLDDDLKRTRMASDGLLAALNALDNRPHGWTFTGTIAALATRESPAKAKLIVMFETLENEDPEEARRQLAPLLAELSQR